VYLLIIAASGLSDTVLSSHEISMPYMIILYKLTKCYSSCTPVRTCSSVDNI